MILLFFLVVLATVNGVNITDGLDGLCSSVTAAVAVFFAIAAALVKSEIFPLPIAVFAALIAFLLFNTHPAKIFMGDTGSLFLGGLVVGGAFMLNSPLTVVIFGLWFIVETASVILQVASFKLTGKRIFKMAPIHHHFEMCGWSEIKIVTVSGIITAAMCAVSWLALKGIM